MSNALASRLGEDDNGGTMDALFLKLFAGEVLASFRKKALFLDKHMVRTVSAGKSATFPVVGRTSATTHAAGAEILGQEIRQSEAVITIDGKIISSVFVDELDEAMNHFDLRSYYAQELGFALAQEFDNNVARSIGLASRATANLTELPGGTTVTSATSKTVADDLAAAIFDAAEQLDTNEVPETDRYCVVKPAQYYLLVESSTKAIHRDYNGAGSYSDGSIIRIAGIPIFASNNVPSTDIRTTTNNTKYEAAFNTSAAFVWHKSAVGTVKLMDLAVRADYDPRRLGYLTVGKYAMGHGTLRPEAAVEIRTGAPAA